MEFLLFCIFIPLIISIVFVISSIGALEKRVDTLFERFTIVYKLLDERISNLENMFVDKEFKQTQKSDKQIESEIKDLEEKIMKL
jgi:hypothetical protein